MEMNINLEKPKIIRILGVNKSYDKINSRQTHSNI